MSIFHNKERFVLKFHTWPQFSKISRKEIISGTVVMPAKIPARGLLREAATSAVRFNSTRKIPRYAAGYTKKSMASSSKYKLRPILPQDIKVA